MCFIGFNELIGKQYGTFASESNHTQRQNFVVPTSILIIIIHIQTLLLA